jgi:hypothetical protein
MWTMALRPNPWPARVPRLADGAAYARCFDHWGAAAYGEVVRVYQLGFLQPSGRRRWGWRPALPMPMLQLVVEPGRSIDFADPVHGFPGLGQEPHPERVLTLWADDLLSVSHGDEWTFVVEAQQPFEREWLDLLAPPRGTTYGYWHAVVAASFAGPRPAGRFRVADVDATTHLTRVHIRDRRGSRAQGSFGRRRQDVRGPLD